MQACRVLLPGSRHAGRGAASARRGGGAALRMRGEHPALWLSGGFGLQALGFRAQS